MVPVRVVHAGSEPVWDFPYFASAHWFRLTGQPDDHRCNHVAEGQRRTGDRGFIMCSTNLRFAALPL